MERLPRAVDAPSLEALQAMLDEVPGNLIRWVVSAHREQGWNWVILEVPSNPSHSVILYPNIQMLC